MSVCFYKVLTFNGDPVSWTAVAPPMDCFYMSVTNMGASSMLFRTHVDDPDTEWSEGANSAEMVIATHSGNVPRFPANQPILFFKTMAGIGPLICKFVR